MQKKKNTELGEVRKRNIQYVEDGKIQVHVLFIPFITGYPGIWLRKHTKKCYRKLTPVPVGWFAITDDNESACVRYLVTKYRYASTWVSDKWALFWGYWIRVRNRISVKIRIKFKIQDM